MQGEGLPARDRVRLFRPTFYKRITKTERDGISTAYYFDDAIETPDSLVVAIMIEPPYNPLAVANMLVEIENVVYPMHRFVGDFMFVVLFDAQPVEVEYEIHP